MIYLEFLVIDIVEPISDNYIIGITPYITPGFRSRPVLGRLRLRLLVKDNIILEFLKTDYELSKTRSNTCPSTCRSYFMFTLEKTSNDVKLHVIFVNY